MSQSTDNGATSSTTNNATTTSSATGIRTKTNNQNASDSDKVAIVDAVILNVYLKFSYPELEDFVDELMKADERFNSLSVLQRYALESTRDPIDMGNQSDRTKYVPILFTRKNDALGLWHFNFLLNLLEIEYQYAGKNGKQFPKHWKTTSETTVKVYKGYKNIQQTSTSTESKVKSTQQQQDNGSLKDLIKTISRENKYGEVDEIKWLNAFKEEHITTVEHLRTAVANEDCWNGLSTVKPIVKQMVTDYLRSQTASSTYNATDETYKNSKATLLGDIHRVRRYFHDKINTVEHIPKLDPEAVKRAIEEIGSTYDDDGNVLDNIQAYLRTFCLENNMATPAEREQQHQSWVEKQDELSKVNKTRRTEAEKLRILRLEADKKVESLKNDLQMIIDRETEVETKAINLILQASNMDTSNINGEWRTLQEQAKKLKFDYQKEKQNAEIELKNAEAKLAEHATLYQELTTKIAEDDAQIRVLDALCKLDLTKEHHKLTAKYGRGLLLYGPPGTGKSALLKQAATFTGITMVTTPLSAGELNRPLVGQTEKLLTDIMSRAKTIPYLICAITIDEIDGLAPKRDNNAQQSKVDGLSVLLSHIEGVNDIKNLIIFGATNRRNVMDEAFLRRMQAKCFVGRPSPKRMIILFSIQILIRYSRHRERERASHRDVSNYSFFCYCTFMRKKII